MSSSALDHILKQVFQSAKVSKTNPIKNILKQVFQSAKAIKKEKKNQSLSKS